MPAKTIEDRSAIAVFSATGATAFGTGSDSPVSADSSSSSRSWDATPRVGGDPVALTQHEQVTGNDFLGGHVPLTALPDHRRRRVDRGSQCQHGAFCARFLHEAEHGVEDDDRRDDERLELLADQERHRRRRQQQRDQRVGQLPGGDRDVRRPARHGKPVGADLGEPAPGGGLLEAAVEVGRRARVRGRRARSSAAATRFAADDSSAGGDARCAGRSRHSSNAGGSSIVRTGRAGGHP